MGEWENEKMHGQGTFTFADGSQYKGDFENSKETGRGIFTYPDGRTYEPLPDDGSLIEI